VLSKGLLEPSPEEKKGNNTHLRRKKRLTRRGSVVEEAEKPGEKKGEGDKSRTTR